MKVLVVGFSKTGTKTMNAALSKMGYDVIYDYEHNFYYLRKEWIKILTVGGTKEDFYNMYKDVDVSLDMPANVFWEEILEAFPDMKMIYMERKNEEDWMRSWDKQVQMVADNWTMKCLTWFSPTARSIFSYTHHLGRVIFSARPQRFYQAYLYISPTVAKKRYRDHNTSVLTRAPKDQLLKFSFKEGWEPLCKFLGKPVPDTPFPHKNQRGTVLDDWLETSPIFIGMKQEMKVVLAIFVAVAAIAFFFFYTKYF